MINMSTTPVYPVVTVKQVSNGFTLIQQTTQPMTPFNSNQPKNEQVALDFPSMVSLLATVFGVDLPSDTVSTAITATLAAKTVTAQPVTATPVTTPT